MVSRVLVTASILILAFPALLAVTVVMEVVLGLAPQGWDRPAHIAIGLTLVGVIVAALTKSVPRGYLATLQGTALWVPWTAALASSAVYLATNPGDPTASQASERGAHSLLIGGGLAGALWLLYAVVDRSYPTARRQSPGWYGLLKDGIALFKLRAAEASAAYPDRGDANKAKLIGILNHLAEVENSLEVPGLAWVTRDGFSVAWTAFHNLDEAMIGVTTNAMVIDVGISDLLRLDGSDIKGLAALQTDLLTALIELDPKIKPYVSTILPAGIKPATQEPDPPAKKSLVATISGVAVTWVKALVSQVSAIRASASAIRKSKRVTAAAAAVAAQKQAVAEAEAKAAAATEALAKVREAERRPRIVIQSIHRALNTYRGSRWAVLGRARWQLMLITTVAGIVGFLVLALSLIGGVTASHLEAGWAYFLIGAVAGLFLRLRLASEESQVSDDYGLEAARVYQTPLLSGIAAVIGVVLMASIAGSQLGDVLNPINEQLDGATVQVSPAPAASGTVASSAVPSGAVASASVQPSAMASQQAAAIATASTPPQFTNSPLDKAFTIGSFPLGIVLALAFGLTPNLVLRRLGISASEAKKQLVATRPT